MIKYFQAISFLFLAQILFAQEIVQPILFVFTFNGNSIELGKSYYSKNLNDSVQIDNLRMYISDVYILSNETIVDTVDKKHHLIDLENPESLKMDFSISEREHFNKIRFTIGIDSLTNVSGAMGGDLDPTTGMYWAWQSGYINFKLEGKSKVCVTRNNVFQFHLGGYQSPNNSAQTISLSVSDSEPIVIHIPIDKLLDTIDIKTTNEIMSPGKKAAEISKQLSEIIIVK